MKDNGNNTKRRKVFVSVLGTGIYNEVTYHKGDDFECCTRFAQEATIRYLMKTTEPWTADDAVYVLVTEQAKRENWNAGITERERNGEKVPYIGLEKVLKDARLPMHVEHKDIPDGKNTDEMWDIFDKMYDIVEENDELYLDITHSFRYIPMLLLVFCNYVRQLKNAEVRGVSYGNIEGGDKAAKRAPLTDLMPLIELQKWTMAAGSFVRNGSVDDLVELGNKSLKPVLKETKGKDESATAMKHVINSLDDLVKDLRNTRVGKIIKAESVSCFRKNISEAIGQDFIKPLNHILQNVQDSFRYFSETEDVKNGYAAARWCFDKGLYQQAVTILRENIVSEICVEQKLDIKKEKEREYVEKALITAENRCLLEKPSFEVDVPKDEGKEYLEVVNRIFETSKPLKKYYEIYSELGGLRNDYNHAGCKENSSSAKDMIDKLRKLLERLRDLSKQI